MHTSSTLAIPDPRSTIDPSSIRDYFTLLKPGVMTLVVFTGAAGMWLAPGKLHPFLQLITVFAIALGSGGGAAINMWYDRDIDSRMKRTLTRPIPAGRIPADDALFMGILLSLASVGLLGLATNWVAASWLAFAIFFYAVIYTMILKRATPQNIVIGGAAGAFPAVIGWAAVSTDPALMPWLMFAIVFLWTPPHFWALALYRHEDYRNAGVPMLPVVAGQQSTRRYIFAYTLLMVAASLTPLLAGSGAVYGLSALVLGARFIVGAWGVLCHDEPKRAMRLFGYSILYLFALFAMLVADHWVGSPALPW